MDDFNLKLVEPGTFCKIFWNKEVWKDYGGTSIKLVSSIVMSQKGLSNINV